MQYWINHNGVQSGPVDAEGLKELGLTSRAYVWHEGLADWVKITQVPELQGLYEKIEEPAVQGQPMAEQASAGQPVQQPYQQQPYQQQYQQPYQQPAQGTGTSQPEEAPEPCPPTNLVWAIISTILCCLPTGIVAIIYATKVSSRYQMGDIEGAKRASETGAWWCIVTIILGILFMPIAMLFSGVS